MLLTFEEADAHDRLQDAAPPERAGLAWLRQQEPAFCAGVEAALTRARLDYSL